MFDVRRLALLRELAQRGTIAAAAQACSLTPSAVSQQLAALQREAGTALYLRDGRRLLLTRAGRALVAHTEEVLADLERASAIVAELSGGVGGVVRLAAFPTAASSLVPGAIASCRAEHPDLRVVLEEREAADGVAALKAGHLDVVLVYEYNVLPEVTDPGIELTPLVREPLLAAVPPEPRFGDGPVTLRRLRAESWIAPGSDAALRSVLERACGLAGFRPRLDYTSDDYTVILALVAAGLGVSLVPSLAAESVSSGVRLLDVAEPELSRSVSAAVRAGSGAAPGIALLLAALRAAAAEREVS